MRYMPIVLLIGIIANTACVLLFRLKLDRRHQEQLRDISNTFHSQLVSFSSDALSRIDNYIISNRTQSVNSTSSDTDSISSALFSETGDCDYHYFTVSGSPCARIGITDFYVGSRFPRGGFITAIFPDSIIVNDEYLFKNRQFTSYYSNIHSSLGDSIPGVNSIKNQPLNKGTNNVTGVNTMR